MALPSFGVPLNIAQIAGEFGGSAPHGMSEYYAGGANVAAGTQGYLGAIPSSGAISINHFYDASAVPPTADFTIDPIREKDDNLIFLPPSGEYGWSLYGRGYGSRGWGTLVSGTTLFITAVQAVFQEAATGRWGILVITGGNAGWTGTVQDGAGTVNLDSATSTPEGPFTMYNGGSIIGGLYQWWFDQGTFSGSRYQQWTSGNVVVHGEKK